MVAKWHLNDKGHAVLDFEKFQGKPLWDVDTGYLRWMCNEHANKGSFPEDLILHVEEELMDRGVEIPSGG